MHHIGIIGTNYGCDVLLPAFAADPRCEVVAICGHHPEKTRRRADTLGVRACAEVEDLFERVDVIAVAVPPKEQPALISRALEAGKPVFAEKPLATDIVPAVDVAAMSLAAGLPVAVDFNLPEFAAFQQLKGLLDGNAIGKLRSVSVTWLMENRAVQFHQNTWKLDVLANFGSHTLHYLQWLFGDIVRIGCTLGCGGGGSESQALLSVTFASGLVAGAHINCAAYAGRGHCIEVFGEDGTLTLSNERTPANKWFEVRQANRGGAWLALPTDDAFESLFEEDMRVPASARIASRFLDAIERGRSVVTPGLIEAVQVQRLLAYARGAHTAHHVLALNPHLEAA